MTAPQGSAGRPAPILERGRLRTSLLVTLALLALNLIAFNALVAGWSGLRVDMTEEGIYSITPATKRILSALEDDVLVYGFFSKRTHPKLAPLVPRIEDMLSEYAALSGGRVKVEILDPKDDAMAEAEANDRFGVQSTPFRLASKYESGIVNAYFAIVVQRGDQYERYGFDDLIEVERLPDGDVDVKLRNLEYDLTRAIKKVVYGFRGTAELFSQVKEPIRFVTVMTPDTLPELLSGVPDAVRAAAAELEEKGGTNFDYEEINPSDDALRLEVEQKYGARPMTLGLFSDQSFYLYGYLTVGERMEQFNLVAEEITAAAIREAVEEALRRQAPGFLKTVGVSAPDMDLPPEVLAQLQMQGRFQQPPPEFQQVKQYLARDYNVADVELEAPQGIGGDVDVLLVLKPKELSERAVYNLDQYLMRGGRVILCAGKYDTQLATGEIQVLPMRSGLEDWLAHYGVSIGDSLVLDDRNQPLPIPEVRRTLLGNIRTWSLQPYPYLVEVRDEGLVNRQITARLEAVGIYWGSPLAVDTEAAAGLDVDEILRSSDRSWTSTSLTDVRSAAYTVPDATEPHLLAVALSGRFESYWAGKQPPAAATPAAAGEGEEPPPPSEVPLQVSPETRLVVVGDAVYVSDLVGSLLSQTGGGFFQENLAFVQNLIDWSTLDNDLVGIRARGAAARHLQRVEPASQKVIEAVNYIVPLALLLALGYWRLWLRRHTAPVVAVARAGREG